MSAELRQVADGFGYRVKSFNSYDVNGYRFHTMGYEQSWSNRRTTNTGVFTPGQDGIDYYGRLLEIYELQFYGSVPHYYRSSYLSWFQRAICPGFGTGIRLPGQKLWRLLSRVVEPGQNVPHAKIFLRPAGFEPKTYCLAHGFLANSPKQYM